MPAGAGYYLIIRLPGNKYRQQEPALLIMQSVTQAPGGRQQTGEWLLRNIMLPHGIRLP